MRGWQRWWPVSGIVFVVLFVIVFLLVGDTGNSASDSAKALTDNGDQLFAGFVISVLAMLALLMFFTGVRFVVRAVAPDRPWLASMVFGSAVAAAALLPGSLAILMGGAQAAHDAGIHPELAAFVTDTQYPFLVAGYMFIAAAVLATNIAWLRTPSVPKWLAWSGIVAGVIGLASVVFFPILLVALWLLVAAVTLTARPPALTDPRVVST